MGDLHVNTEAGNAYAIISQVNEMIDAVNEMASGQNYEAMNKNYTYKLYTKRQNAAELRWKVMINRVLGNCSPSQRLKK